MERFQVEATFKKRKITSFTDDYVNVYFFKTIKIGHFLKFK